MTNIRLSHNHFTNYCHNTVRFITSVTSLADDVMLVITGGIDPGVVDS